MYNHALTNGVLGIQKPNEPGVMIYLLPLGNGVTKGNSSRGWGTPLNSFWCCYGTAVESFSKLADSIYFKQRPNATSTATTTTTTTNQEVTADAQQVAAAPSVSSLIVARFADSVVQPTADSIGLTQAVDLTAVSMTSTMTVNISATTTTAAAKQASVKILIPSWTEDGYAGIRLLPPTVNGKPPSSGSEPGKPPTLGQFATVLPPRAGGWVGGDTIKMELPCPLKLRKLDDNRTEYGSMYSLVSGDVLLVGLESVLGAPNRLVVPSTAALRNVTSWVAVSEASTARTPLRFAADAAGGNKLELMPLNEVVDERYTVYFNISVATA